MGGKTGVILLGGNVIKEKTGGREKTGGMDFGGEEKVGVFRWDKKKEKKNRFKKKIEKEGWTEFPKGEYREDVGKKPFQSF